MSRREPHVPVHHQRTRVLDNQLARLGAREPVPTNDALLLALADLVADVDAVVDRVAPASVPFVVDLSPTTGDGLPRDDGDGTAVVRPLRRRRQTWSVVSATGIAASFVAAGLLSSSTRQPAITSPSMSAAAETEQLLAHATQILPSAKASNAAHVAYARELAADLTHAASLLPQVQDPQAHASLASRLADLREQAPPPPLPSPTAPPSRSGAKAKPRDGTDAPPTGSTPTKPASSVPTSTTHAPPARQTVVRPGSGQRSPAQVQPSPPSQPANGEQPPPHPQPAAGQQQPPAGQQPPGQQLP